MTWFNLILEEVQKPFLYFIHSSQRIYWVYLLSAIACALVVYVYSKSHANRLSLKGFLTFCFPKSIYFHKSAKLDYCYFIINRIFLALLFIPALTLIYPYLTKVVSSGLAGLFGTVGWSIGTPFVFNLLFTVVSVLAIDFGVYLSHYLLHKVPFLWEFHKVHHSAEVMTPLTLYRMHPVDEILAFGLTSAISGSVAGVFAYLCGNEVTPYTFWGVNVVIFTFYICGYNLRHSHVWLSFGSKLEKLFISPALHQVHHSTDPKHFDKNMGLIFSIWDRLFQTFYLPERKENLTFGLGTEETKEYSSISRLYLRPFYQNAKSMSRWSVLFCMIALFLGVGFYSLGTKLKPWLERSQTKVLLEELTSAEVAKLVADGYTTVLVPTGGVEQNGPHMVLGKHNYIVKFTAEEIAHRLGETLVAPVLPYVPEGAITPPKGHMRYAGTLSIPRGVFEGVLEYTARSLKAHGFRTICFIGDSGGNQASQKKVMNTLNKEWRQSRTRVYSISDYYSKNNQKQFLQNQGETLETIGGHAGIRDTSELLYVYPKGIRKDIIRKYGTAIKGEGYSGAISKASDKRGEQLLELKVKAAVKQIRRLRG